MTERSNAAADFRGLLPEAGEVRRSVVDTREDLAVSGLAGASLSIALAEILLAHPGAALVVTADGAAARRVADDLRFLFERTGHDERVRVYPPYDIAPYESLSPHGSIIAARMAALAELAVPRSRAIVVAAAGALLKRTLPRERLSATSLRLKVGDEVDRDLVVLSLDECGYRRAPLVEDIGEFAVRGGVVDFWSPLSDDPLRIELSGDEIRSIRAFHPGNQTTRRHLDRARVFPCREMTMGKDAAARLAARAKTLADEQNVDRRVRDRLVEEVEEGISAPGIEFLLPLFHERLDAVTDFLPGDALAIAVEPELVDAMLEIEHDLHKRRFEDAREAGKLVVPPDELYLSPDEFDEAQNRFRRVALGAAAPLPKGRGVKLAFETHSLAGLRDEILAHAREEHPLAPLTTRLKRWLADDWRVAIAARAPSGVDRLRRLLEGYGFSLAIGEDVTAPSVLSRPASVRVPIVVGPLSHGAVVPAWRTAIVTEEEIFGPRKHAEAYRGKRGEPVADFADLAPGDAIVHAKHGVGIFKGLSSLRVGGADTEYLNLEYAGGDKLYLPVDRLSQVHRYVGAGGLPIVDRLGGATWEKALEKARVAARRMARDLLALYAKRHAEPGFAFAPGGEAFEEFEGTFPFDETPDQLTVIAETLDDMAAGRPMDRLVCGDVGFGKTEVAMRAAFLAVQNKKQVAVLVPTTTLAFQHGRTFARRMSPFGVNVAVLSRFVSSHDRKKVRDELAAGLVDVVIGTHQLLSARIRFADLGLLIVDEEQNFGVAQKERIKKLREIVDVLTLTATPIPRTLHMSLVGIRDLSVINTPPEDRLSVRTFVTRWDDDIIREAIGRELTRGGQVFVIHNRVQSIDGIADRVRRLVPHARVRVGHGQMAGEEIEELLIDFAERRFDILVATTIVGSGLDFPQANTMIINRADMLGLSQLYQLRGRVGRSKVRAYCYLIVPREGRVTEDAVKRISAIKTFSELGSGYKIAAKDLEIRGAGNLLGAEQSGHIALVGYELYRELLDEEVARLKGEPFERPIDTEVNIPVPALLPDAYVPDEHLRLSLYKRISDAAADDELERLRDEIVDRFGPPPPEVERLFAIVGLRLVGRSLGVKQIDYSRDAIVYTFDERTPIAASALVSIVAAKPAVYRLLPDGKLLEKVPGKSGDAIVAAVRDGLNALENCVTNRQPFPRPDSNAN
ncbi:transcription-repair coupling factor [bacterium]|nr:transcription-repair coupling factor [bacterium]